MRRLFIIAIVSLLCQITFAQDKYVYGDGGKLRYVVSDTLKTKYHESDYFSESTTVLVGSHVAYETTKHLVNTGDEWKHVATTCKPLIFGVTISKQSLRSLKTWLYYVKENYQKGDPTTKYSFMDESRELVMLIVKPQGYNVWMLRVDDKELRVDFLDKFIPSLEELESILKSKQTEWDSCD